MKIIDKLKVQKGMAALFTILVIGAAALIIARSATFLSIGSLDTTFIIDKEREVEYLTDGCIGESLRRLQLDRNYVATNFVLAQDNGSCSVTVSGSGYDRVINAIGTVGSYNKKITAELTIDDNNQIIINTWHAND